MKSVFLILMTSFYSLCIGSLVIRVLTGEKKEKLEHEKKNRLTKILEFTNRSIYESNIKYYIPRYNILWHFTLALILFATSYNTLNRYPFEYKVLLSIIVFLIPWMLIQFIKTKTTIEIKKQILDVLISFKAYYSLKKDIFQAFSMLEDNISEPVRSAVSVLNKQYKIKNSGDQCLEVFKKRFADLKMRMFVDQLKLAIKTGGDIESICTKFINDMSKYEEIEDRDKLDGLTDKYGLYLLILINVSVMHYMMISNSAFIRFVTFNPLGKVTLIADYVICIVLFFRLIKDG